MSQVVVTFYKFVSLPDYTRLQAPILAYCQQQAIKGTILLACEGINATLAGTRAGIDAVLSFLRRDSRFEDLEVKESLAESPPFERMKVKLKREIVTLGQPQANPHQQVGIYVSPKDWNELISDPDVMVIDTRNDYEVSIGTFQGAINPQTHSFREFPNYIQNSLDPTQPKKIAMFCTGGIRCEKASSYLITQGFEQVYHLKGGILKYLEEIPPEESLWEGECFVFDERIAIKHQLEPGSYDMCRSCGHPISEMDKESPQYEEGICCPYCFESLGQEKRKRQQEKVRQLQLKSRKAFKNG
ncbi:rhodanese-related sulfurtransferase [Gloeothece verrucosa]|uniref:tRNA uridine(34) hydroxylase n=1 Tax=Gloeothece verrucosa (strain PCC 7822) TaxID=497965 RepID=E0U539_GLOV7|nr:rhodanese-related sulfurtransferase [Gloeothece verrucosa]ADN12318.1 Rhodanese domain protein [Gloeothece verrucosa PCC 7822]